MVCHLQRSAKQERLSHFLFAPLGVYAKQTILDWSCYYSPFVFTGGLGGSGGFGGGGGGFVVSNI